MWICQACGADVQDDWDVCWRCTQPRDGAPPPTTGPLIQEADMQREVCPKCHSSMVIPDVQVGAFQAGNLHHLWLSIPENPDALIFKNLAYSALRAWVCGRCGYSELYTTQPDLLWDAYQRSLLKAEDGKDRSDDESEAEDDT